MQNFEKFNALTCYKKLILINFLSKNQVQDFFPKIRMNHFEPLQCGCIFMHKKKSSWHCFTKLKKTSFWANFGSLLAQKLHNKVLLDFILLKIILLNFKSFYTFVTSFKKSEKFHVLTFDNT